MMFRPGCMWEGRRPHRPGLTVGQGAGGTAQVWVEDSTLPAQAPRAGDGDPVRRTAAPPDELADTLAGVRGSPPVRKTKAIIPNGGVIPLQALPMTRPSVRVRRSLPVVLSYLLFVNPASTGSVTPVT
jgi:hypothetical protein